jgi:hypothetical protein
MAAFSVKTIITYIEALRFKTDFGLLMWFGGCYIWVELHLVSPIFCAGYFTGRIVRECH